MNGNDTLNEASRLIYGNRHAKYGDAKEDFGATAAMWTAILKRKGFLLPDAQLDAHSVAIMMVALKLSREAHVHTEDNCVDGCGYLALAMDVSQ